MKTNPRHVACTQTHATQFAAFRVREHTGDTAVGEKYAALISHNDSDATAAAAAAAVPPVPTYFALCVHIRNVPGFGV